MGETWLRPLIDSVTTPSPTPWGLAAGHYPLPRLPRPPQQRGSLALQNTLSMSDVPNPGVPRKTNVWHGLWHGLWREYEQGCQHLRLLFIQRDRWLCGPPTRMLPYPR